MAPAFFENLCNSVVRSTYLYIQSSLATRPKIKEKFKRRPFCSVCKKLPQEKEIGIPTYIAIRASTAIFSSSFPVVYYTENNIRAKFRENRSVNSKL